MSKHKDQHDEQSLVENFFAMQTHWVIVGGESGHYARPMKTKWVQDVRKQCRAQKIPFFFKQWGGKNKKEAGRLLNGRTYDGMPRSEVFTTQVVAQRH